jgi:hypothetical protein
MLAWRYKGMTQEKRSPAAVVISLLVLVVFCANVIRGVPTGPFYDCVDCGHDPIWKPPILTLAQTYPVIFGGLILASAVVGIVLRSRLQDYAVAMPILMLTALGLVALFV